MSIPRKLKSMQRAAHFCVVAWVCVLSSLVSRRAPQPKVPDSVHRGKGLSFVLRSDGMADSSQLPCTCHWLSVSQGQILLSVSTVRRTLQRAFLGWAGSTISDAMKHAVTELVSCRPWSTEPAPPISTISRTCSLQASRVIRNLGANAAVWWSLLIPRKGRQTHL